jgi:hypothetical protein
MVNKNHTPVLTKAALSCRPTQKPACPSGLLHCGMRVHGRWEPSESMLSSRTAHFPGTGVGGLSSLGAPYVGRSIHALSASV